MISVVSTIVQVIGYKFNGMLSDGRGFGGTYAVTWDDDIPTVYVKSVTFNDGTDMELNAKQQFTLESLIEEQADLDLWLTDKESDAIDAAQRRIEP